VAGNQDGEEVSRLLPLERRVDIDSRSLLVIHGHQGRTALATATTAAAAASDVDCVIFGHSHRAYKEYVGHVLLFNPGSPTWARFSKQRTFGFLDTGPELTAEIHEI
jgi:putative phosphoesterase